MNVEQYINPVSPVFFQSNAFQFKQNKETFDDIFQQLLNDQSDPRPPKIELTGTLIPALNSEHRSECDFQLETDQREYILRMSDALKSVAKKLEWEVVTVKGYIDPNEGIFEVEKIYLSYRNEPYHFSLGPTDLSFEVNSYKKLISRKGKLELAPEYLVS